MRAPSGGRTIGLITCFLAGLLASGLSAVAGDDFDPVKAVRGLSRVQEALTRGRRDALKLQSLLMEQISTGLEKTERERWRERRHVVAAAKFLLSGGNSDFATAELDELVPDDLKPVWQAAKSYASGDAAAARSGLANVNPRETDPMIAGHIALIKGLLAAGSRPDAALRLFAEARLLGWGTLVEEAALRRELALLAPRTEQQRFWAVSDRYARRYAESVFARAFRMHLAEGLVARGIDADAESQKRLTGLLARLKPAVRSLYCVDVAEYAILKGEIALARLVTGLIEAENVPQSQLRDRARLFSAAIGVVGMDPRLARRELEGLSGLEPGSQEARLRTAAMKVVHEIEAPLGQTPAGHEPKPGGTELPGHGQLAAAMAALSEADRLLSRSVPSRSAPAEGKEVVR